MSDILMKGTEPIGQVSDLTADNVEYSSGVSVKDKIDEKARIITFDVTFTTNSAGIIPMTDLGLQGLDPLKVLNVLAYGVNKNRYAKYYSYGNAFYIRIEDAAGDAIPNEQINCRIFMLE